MAGVGVVVLALVGAVVVAVWPEHREPVAQPPDSVTSPPGPWLSGAAGTGVVDGDYGAWRGRPVEISATWVDNDQAMVKLSQLHPGEEFGDWDPPLDVAIGAFSGDDESWADAADGAYDDRWRTSLTNLRELREGKSGTTYIRFAHEMNGNWYQWSVNEDNAKDFVKAWRRFRALQQKVFPEAQLVFCVNRESVDTGMDWRDFFPGARYVDVLGVDYYNTSPAVSSAKEWADSLDDTDKWGGPRGLAQHLAFAKSVGLPLAVPEWSGNADEGDSPAFIKGMHDFFDKHGGTGPGQLLYEIQFNEQGDDDNWALYDPSTRMPKSAKTYQALW
jgi:Glycosyl hydrolase family 26